jgi:hypothetical protein
VGQAWARPSGLKWSLALLVVAAAMLWPAAINGRPAYYFDSLGYYANGHAAVSGLGARLHPHPQHQPGANAGPARPKSANQVVATRAVAYAVFAYLFSGSDAKMVPVILVQALVVSAMLMIWWRQAAAGIDWREATAAGVAMAALTTASWVASFAMPDIFAGVALLGFVIMSFPSETPLRLWAKLFIVLTIAFAFAAHASHMPFLLAVAGLAIALRLWRTRRSKEGPDWLGSIWLASPIAIGMAAVFATSVIGFSQVTLTPKRLPIVLARSIQDGPARWYLQQHCATEKYVICQFLPTLPKKQADILFGPGGLRQRATPQQMEAIRQEESVIVQAATRAYPMQELYLAGRRALLQIFYFGLGETNFLSKIEPGPEGVMVLKGAPEPAPIRPAFTLLIYATVIASVGALAVMARRPRPGELDALVLGAAGVLANAVLTGALSAVANRYQARVIWILPALAVAFWLARRVAARAAEGETAAEPPQAPALAESA